MRVARNLHFHVKTIKAARMLQSKEDGHTPAAAE